MKKLTIILSAFAVVFGMASCNDELELRNPNNQTTYDFGDSESELQEAVVSCYNRVRLEGTFARVGYTMDAVRGDEMWNASQIWYLPYDNLNISAGGDDIGTQWIWRDNYHVVNRCNFVLKKVEEAELSEKAYNEIKGQALFLRALAYYTIATYYQTAPLFNDYDQYSSMETMYAPLATQDELFDQIDADLVEAMEILPSRNDGGEWAAGRATCGAAAGYYARSLMFRHKFSDALTVLRDIIAGKYGTYKLMADFGDNFREGAAENNEESLFEVQYLDYGMGGVDEEWTPVNISSNATQGHAVESNYAPSMSGSWADLAVSPWLYNLYKAEKCTDGTLDPRLYWTIASYEPEYDTYTGGKNAGYPSGNDPRCNVIYQTPVTETPVANGDRGGFSAAKWTYARLDVCSTVVTGLHCGINIRLMRYSDVLLRAAECINEIDGPNAEAIGYINQVRKRAGLAELELSDFPTANKLFEQIANVERPKEFGCENGRGIDLLRWGFFYSADRLAQLKDHGNYVLDKTPNTTYPVVNPSFSSFQFYQPGHEYFPIYQGTLNANLNLGSGNSANTNTDNAPAFKEKYGEPRPVTAL